MIRFATILLIQCMAMTAVFFVLEGHAWIDQGYGIHPLVAGVMATLLLISPYLLPRS